MAGLGLQRSAVSFRRQGSSGFVWDDKFLSEEISKAEAAAAAAAAAANNNQQDNNKELLHQDASSAATPPLQINTVQRSRSNSGGARGYRTGKVSPAIEPPSPKLSACGFCAAFWKNREQVSSYKPSTRQKQASSVEVVSFPVGEESIFR